MRDDVLATVQQAAMAVLLGISAELDFGPHVPVLRGARHACLRLHVQNRHVMSVLCDGAGLRIQHFREERDYNYDLCDPESIGCVLATLNRELENERRLITEGQ